MLVYGLHTNKMIWSDHMHILAVQKPNIIQILVIIISSVKSETLIDWCVTHSASARHFNC